MIPVLDAAGGRDMRHEICARAGVFELPDGSEMISEQIAARLHREVRMSLPDLAPGIAWAAGGRTADYILAHRIPRTAQIILRHLPAFGAAPLLAGAIEKHAWTFCGSGRFKRLSAWGFEIADNPVVRGEEARAPMCHWHRAVFSRLYEQLVTPDVVCREVRCCAAGDDACRFELSRSAP